VVRNRGGQTADFRQKNLDVPHDIAAFRPLIDPDVILCSDGANLYKTFARATGMPIVRSTYGMGSARLMGFSTSRA